MNDAHLMAAREVAARLEVDPALGLDAEDALARRERYGLNRLPEPAPRGLWQRMLDQFRPSRARW